MQTNPNDSAYPTEVWEDRGGNDYQTFVGGLTKREYFAAMAMVGLCVGMNTVVQEIEMYGVQQKAVALADALINQLNQNK